MDKNLNSKSSIQMDFYGCHFMGTLTTHRNKPIGFLKVAFKIDEQLVGQKGVLFTTCINRFSKKQLKKIKNLATKKNKIIPLANPKEGFVVWIDDDVVRLNIDLIKKLQFQPFKVHLLLKTKDDIHIHNKQSKILTNPAEYIIPSPWDGQCPMYDFRFGEEKRGEQHHISFRSSIPGSYKYKEGAFLFVNIHKEKNIVNLFLKRLQKSYLLEDIELLAEDILYFPAKIEHEVDFHDSLPEAQVMEGVYDVNKHRVVDGKYRLYGLLKIDKHYYLHPESHRKGCWVID